MCVTLLDQVDLKSSLSTTSGGEEEEEWREGNGGGTAEETKQVVVKNSSNNNGTSSNNSNNSSTTEIDLKKEEEDKDKGGSATSVTSTTSSSSNPAEESVGKLRLNASLATDPAIIRPSVETERTISRSTVSSGIDREDSRTPLHDIVSTTPTATYIPPPPVTPTPNIPSAGSAPPPPPPVYLCTPCGIRFSSLSTLEAHQTYYCSHRMPSLPRGGTGCDSEPEDVKCSTEENAIMSGNESNTATNTSITSTAEPPSKSVRSGKLYKCPHCSYSADKKVSLNRHMRMHASSPGGGPACGSERSSSPQQPAIDRYCQDCDIRFSSSKTFRAHKQHYCSTRHVIKPKPISSPPSPPELVGSGSPVETVVPRDQPYLALPTNPILIVPYSLLQGASLLSGAAAAGMPPTDTACLLLPDGTLQPLAQALPTRHISAAADKVLPRPPPFPSPQVQKVPLEKTSSKPRTEGTSPLDLSCRRSEEREEVVVVDSCEDEKENRQINQRTQSLSPEHEDIICAPSIPLMLSTSSTCSSPSPAPVSPRPRVRSESQSQHSNSPSPKSVCGSGPGTSPSSAKSPRRTPNGLAATKNIKDERRRTPDSLPKQDSNSINLQSLLLAAVTAQSQMDSMQIKPDFSSLPFPPELVPHLSAAYNARFSPKSKPLVPISGLIPPPIPGLSALSSNSRPSSADMLNHAAFLPLITSEMALRLAAAAAAAQASGGAGSVSNASDLVVPPPGATVGGPPPPPPPPQVLVKHGDSKCLECNIVFFKHENYIAHKKHYCSARKHSDVSSQEDKTPSPVGSSSPPITSPKENLPITSKSPVGGSNTQANVVPSTSKPQYQYICAACGIKFTSYDNLTAHQTYYCPKRVPQPEQEKPRRCAKCKMTVTGNEHHCISGGANVSSSTSNTSNGWKCPCCPVTSATAAAAQKHMDTHTGVKAFLCTLCRYKGNTLRGMRTHIRMHFDKRPAEVNEENFITCIIEDGCGGSTLEANSPNLIEDDGATPRRSPRLTSSEKASTACNGSGIPPPALRIKEEESMTSEGNVQDTDEEFIDVDEVVIKEEPSTVTYQPPNSGSTGTQANVIIKNEIDDQPDDLTTSNNNRNSGNHGVGAGNGNTSSGARYCKSCDISFNYLSSFLAHKKFYCSSHLGENAGANNNNNNNNNNNRPAGTPVT